MKTTLIVFLSTCLNLAVAQVCPTFAYGVYAFGTDCGANTTICAVDGDCTPGTSPGPNCCFTGCSSGVKFCINPVFPGCPDGTLLGAACTTDVCTDSPCNAQIGSTCTKICRDCVAQYKDKFGNVIPSNNCKCPTGTALEPGCDATTCTGETCGSYAAADVECRVFGCGACEARFYDKNGNRLDCTPGDPCDPNPCKNGGTCEKDDDKFDCKCTSGYKGDTCDEKKSGLFGGGGDIFQILILMQLLGRSKAPAPPPVLPPVQPPLPCNPCASYRCAADLSATCVPRGCNVPPSYVNRFGSPLGQGGCQCRGTQYVPGCEQTACQNKQCPGYPGATCKVNGCGRCTYAFYDTLGQAVPCGPTIG